eukprot:m51a1_g9310 putative sh2 domain-containing protein (690) ;mRNA; r:97564-102140
MAPARAPPPASHPSPPRPQPCVFEGGDQAPSASAPASAGGRSRTQSAHPANSPKPSGGSGAPAAGAGDAGKEEAGGQGLQPRSLWNSENFERNFNKIKQQSRLKTEQARVTVDEGREIQTDEIELGEKIGEGQFARVFRATCRGKKVAVKVLSIDKCDESFIEDFKREVEAMSKVNHPNVCLYMGACTGMPGKMMIVTPLYTTSLDKILFGQAPLSLALRVRMSLDVAMGMNWLHCMVPKLVHSDLKVSNILVDENYRCVVSDFGQTQILHGITKDLMSWGGTPLYMAPEKLQGLSHTEKIDVYSFGLVLWEILHRQRAFEQYSKSVSLAAFIAAVCDRCERPIVSKDMPPVLITMMVRCWDSNPETRPVFQSIVEDLDQVLGEVTIPDTLGLQFWQSTFRADTSVPWDAFKEPFKKIVGRPTLFWIKPLLAEKVAEKSGGGGAEAATGPQGLRVTMEQFGLLLSYFGPLVQGVQTDTTFNSKNLSDKIYATLREDWFHGDLDSNEASKLLRADGRLGAYLVRFSGREPATFTLSRITGTRDSKEVTHHRIRNTATGQLSFGGAMFSTMPELVSKAAKQYGLRFAVAGSKYGALMERWKAKIAKSRGAKQYTGFHDSGVGNYAGADEGAPFAGFNEAELAGEEGSVAEPMNGSSDSLAAQQPGGGGAPGGPPKMSQFGTQSGAFYHSGQ